jgi:hypothetical protein
MKYPRRSAGVRGRRVADSLGSAGVGDVPVVAEEFGAFADARRRIDLLGVDRSGHVVVIGLKRTTDGGHLELQALRYAAMVSVMTSIDTGSVLDRLLTLAPTDGYGYEAATDS